MSYKSTTIADTLGKLNKSYFLPAIQRPFVWETEQIVRLFDSLMQGYPISSFLFWDLKSENRQSWETYKFVKNFKFGEIHDEKTDASEDDDITLVLDGQQRLTSLMIGLKGTYTVRIKNQRKNNPNAWVQQALFLDLLKNSKPDAEEEDYFEDISYGFKFYDETLPPRNTATNKYWFKVADILTCHDRDIYDDLHDNLLEEAGSLSREQKKIFRANLDRLYHVIWNEQAISYYTEKSQSYDKVLDIFIRANDGGTKLSKSDLLMSMVTLKWSELNARDEINHLVLYLNNELESENNVDRDFVLRSGLLLSELDFLFKIQNFTKDNLAIIEANWPSIKEALEVSFRTVNLFGIAKHNLTSLNAVMVIVYYFHKLIELGRLDDMKNDSRNLESIRHWLGNALLNGIFGGQAGVTIGIARRVIREEISSSYYFPGNQLVAQMTLRGRSAEYDPLAIEKFLGLNYSKKLGFVALSLLYDQYDWLNVRFQKDHLFPLSFFEEEKLVSAGVSGNLIETYIASSDRMPNLVLLSRDEFIEKSQMDFNVWIQTREDSFFTRHLLPTNLSLYRLENFPAFIKHREELITVRLKEFFK
ncbi:DUF262 domain-containing protein [Methylotuvimicrobium buryatense]|uniref:DUF262 domain-containing protein n=1 Tax=Methylotuvimicrobium buryatense TaxID=95641 RepID=A0A4P9UVU1_METBY|nr:DUF262 domain-containing protein [Methylotuvimicrobium buryatense]QCW84581.1 DUF262 domain-containing protein [Methylotuvimicrobium buryatense]